jgi:hypothetical protein
MLEPASISFVEMSHVVLFLMIHGTYLLDTLGIMEINNQINKIVNF